MKRLGTLLAVMVSAGASQEPPVFRADTRLVQVNVVVHDRNGPVANLTKDDFVLTDKGKARAISAFSVSSSKAKTESPPLAEHTFSNRPHSGTSSPGGVTVILLDRLNTLSGAGKDNFENDVAWFEDHALGFAKVQLIEFVKEMKPDDRVAIYSLAKSLSVLCDFTSDREQLLGILARYRATSVSSREKVEPGEVHTGVPGDFDQNIDQERRTMAAMLNADRSRTTIAALLAIANHVADIPGRKNLVWLTANLPFSGAGAGRLLSRANLAIYPIDARGLIPRASAPGNNDETIIPGTRLSHSSGMSRLPGIDTMQELADETGGRAFYDTNDLSGAIRKAVDDAEITYTLGFYPDANSLDDKFHDLKVHVKHSGYEVRAQKGYFALKETPASNMSNQASLTDAILSPLESSAIHFEAKVERTADLVKVTGSIDLRDLQLSDARKGSVELAIVQQDATGAVLDTTRHRYNLALTQEAYASYLKTGLTFREQVAPKEGLATLRVIVGDAVDARVGSVIVPFSAVK